MLKNEMKCEECAMICKFCGNEIDENVAFCPFCGTSLS